MKFTWFLGFWIVLQTSFSLTLNAQPESSGPSQSLEFSLGTDSSPWLFEGGSVIVAAQKGKWRLTGEAWRMTFPDFFVESNDDNKGKGWARQAELGLGLYLDYFEMGNHQGVFYGVVFSTFRSRLEREGFSDVVKFRSSEILGRVGYRWALTDRLSLQPWIAAGPLWTHGDVSPIRGEVYQESPVQVLATMHIMYQL